MIDTGRVCGTSASSEPSVITVLHVELLRHLHDRLGIAPPAQRRLHALEHHQVGVRARDLRGADSMLGPVDLARAALGEPDRRPHRGEVEELVRIDPGDGTGLEARADEPTAAEAESPASFHPETPHTKTGRRSVWRSVQMTSDTPPTVQGLRCDIPPWST